MVKAAINGFGRIGRSLLKRILESYPNIEVKVINDLTDNETLAHLFKYDSVYGIYNKSVEANQDALIIDNKKIECLEERDPANLPWREMGVDVILECTGLFTDFDSAKKHLQTGAKKVIISAPSKSKEVPHFVLGVNQDKYDSKKDNILAMASCTTNCAAPISKALHENLEIESALLTTVHSYTTSQRLLDAPHKDLRRGRAAALSLVPTTTGAAIAVTKTLPELKGKIDGVAIRSPSPIVSIVDLVAKVDKETSVEEVNNLFKEASKKEELKGILGVEDAPLVSIDYKGNTYSAVIDALSTMVQKKKLVKVLAWYDNEWGYASRLAQFAEFVGKKL